MTQDTYKLEKEAREALDKDGPLSHDELTDELGCEWDETQKTIRAMRNSGEVVITLDRRYALTCD